MAGVRSQPTLGEYLVREGIITQKQLLQVQAEQKNNSRSVGRLLVDRGHITEELRITLLRKRFGFEELSLKDLKIEPLLLMLVPHSFAEKHHIVPVRKDDEETLVVAMEDPSDSAVIDTMKAQLGLRIKPFVATRDDIQSVLDTYTRQEEQQHAAASAAEGGKSLFYRIARLGFLPLMVAFPGLLFIADLKTGALGIEAALHITSASLTRWDLILYSVVGWGVWALVMYEVSGLLFGKKKKPGAANEDEEEEEA